jgi:hypothetical protein
MFIARTARLESYNFTIKKGRPTGHPLTTDTKTQSVNDGVNRTTINTGTTISTLIGNCVDITVFYNSAERAGIDTGTTGDTLISDFHLNPPVEK